MGKTVQECVCEKCGNEADMTITCQLVDVEGPSGTKKVQQETRTCTACGGEMVVNIDE